MNEPKEFLGKSLDLAIAEACSYFGVERGKLEITIIEDAKTGIFGIVGARKARITAKLAKLPEFIQPVSDKNFGKQNTPEYKKEKQFDSVFDNIESLSNEIAPKTFSEEITMEETSYSPENKAEQQSNSSEVENTAADTNKDNSEVINNTETVTPINEPEKEEQDNSDTFFPKIALSDLDKETLFGNIRRIVSRLISPLLDISPEEIELNIMVENERVKIEVKNADTGLLIGRDGQNLAAIEYLTARMITKIMCSQIHIQIDAAEYHQKQDSRLQELAHILAERVKVTGKPQMTRPLSAYQRRVIHMTLQDDPDVFTRSSGEGSLKHIVVLRKKTV